MPDTKISALTDGATAAATDRIPAARSPFGATDNRYVTPAYIKDYILGLANTWGAQQTVPSLIVTGNNEAVTLNGSSAYVFATGGFRVGSTGSIRFSDGTDFDLGIFKGTGSPEGVVTASPGSLYLNMSGGTDTTLYTKNSGNATNTGWVAIDNV